MKFFYASLFFFFFFSCSSQSQSVNADEFEKGLLKDSIQVLDVRTAGEYNNGHIKNSMLADWNNQSQFRERIEYVDKNRPVYIYCLVGARSAAAAAWMRKNGFADVIELQGGFNAWKQNNKPVEANSNEKQMSLEEYWDSIPKDKTVLVDFGAVWCPPCIKMEPILQAIKKDPVLHFSFLKVDAGVHTAIMKSLNIEPIPVFIIYKNGKEVWRKKGLVTKEEFAAQLK
ncbi:MAG TPA: rhodanese-like domain-containing protein [Chitinophagaceae bacterium]